MIKKIIILSFVFFIILLCPGCSPKKNAKKIINRVLQRDLIIGPGHNNKDYHLGYISSISVDNNGNIYILGNNKLRKVNYQGEYLWQIRRRGGSGGFKRVVDMAVGPTGRIIIIDQQRKAVITFAGNALFMFAVEIEEGSPLKIAVDSKCYLYLSFANPKKWFLLHKYTPEGIPVKSFLPKDKEERDPLVNNLKNRIHFSTDNNDNIIAVFPYEYKIFKYDSNGKMINRWTRNLSYKPPPFKTVKNKDGKITVQGETIIKDIAVDSRNNIYVLRREKSEENKTIIDIFDTDGHFRGNLDPRITPLSHHQFLYIDFKDNLYVINPLHDAKIFRFRLKQE